MNNLYHLNISYATKLHFLFTAEPLHKNLIVDKLLDQTVTKGLSGVVLTSSPIYVPDEIAVVGLTADIDVEQVVDSIVSAQINVVFIDSPNSNQHLKLATELASRDLEVVVFLPQQDRDSAQTYASLLGLSELLPDHEVVDFIQVNMSH